MRQHERVQVDPGIIADTEILGGKPVIDGTRISVELIMEKIAAGQTVDMILASYSHLNREQVLAALRHAYKLARAEAKAAVEKTIDNHSDRKKTHAV